MQDAVKRKSKGQLLILHLKAEFSVLRQVWWRELPVVLFLYVVCLHLFRILAYVRHVPAEPLKDLGFELIPETDLSVLSDVILLIVHCALGLVCTLGLCKTLHTGTIEQSIFTVNVLTRYANIICIGHVLRLSSYISTSLPGPARHCQIEDSKFIPSPTDFWATFTDRMSSFGQIHANCGDLIFSGHMLQLMVALLLVAYYSNKVLPPAYSLAYTGLTSLLVPIEAFCVIASRRHYTVDITIALWASTLIFIVYNDRIHPYETQPQISEENPKRLSKDGGKYAGINHA